MYDLGIIGGMVYIDHTFQKVNLYIKDEKIQTVTKEKIPCYQEINAKGRYVLPGFIDPHVHFSLGSGSRQSKDDFYSGSKEAILGGVTTYIDFLDPIQKVEELEEAFNKRMKLASRSLVDFAFHTTIRNPLSTAGEIISASKKLGIPSIKLFTTYSDTDRRTYDQQIFKLLEESKKQKAWIVVHAENDDLILQNEKIFVKDHELARPALTENIEVLKLGSMARATGGNLYIVHVSAGSTVEMMKLVFQKELKSKQIVFESCPHYFLLNSEKLSQSDGYKYTMTPPLRAERERKKLNAHLKDITTIGTDHCPFTKEQKEHAYTSEIPMGIGGLRYSFLNMYQQYGFEVVDQFTKNVAKIYGLKEKGQLLPGFDADAVIFNPKGQVIVQDEMSVYDGKKLKGAIETVIARGSMVLEEGNIKAHQGHYIKRGEISERD